MVRGQGKQTPELLSEAERETLVDQRKELEDTMRQTHDFGAGTQAEQIDKGVIQRQINNIDRAIESRSAPRLTGAQKDSLYREAKELEERLSEGLPTRYEMQSPAKNPGAVRKHLKWVNENSQRAERYRYIQRALGEYKSIESLRKEK